MRNLANGWGLTDIEIRSAGTAAAPGAVGCTVAPALQGVADAHRSMLLTPDMTQWADLVVTAAQGHQSAAVELDPGVRPKLFNMRQASRICEWMLGQGMIEAGYQRALQPEGWVSRFLPDDPRSEVAPLPADLSAADSWFVAEMDAARGLAPLPVNQGDQGAGRRRLRTKPATGDPGPEDIVDPHTSRGADIHGVAYEQIRNSVYWLGAGLLDLQRKRQLLTAAGPHF